MTAALVSGNGIAPGLSNVADCRRHCFLYRVIKKMLQHAYTIVFGYMTDLSLDNWSPVTMKLFLIL
jgi:hypothetical protein